MRRLAPHALEAAAQLDDLHRGFLDIAGDAVAVLLHLARFGYDGADDLLQLALADPVGKPAPEGVQIFPVGCGIVVGVLQPLDDFGDGRLDHGTCLTDRFGLHVGFEELAVEVEDALFGEQLRSVQNLVENDLELRIRFGEISVPEGIALRRRHETARLHEVECLLRDVVNGGDIVGQNHGLPLHVRTCSPMQDTNDRSQFLKLA